MESDVLDPQWSPDVFLHICFKGHVVEAGYENSGPVKTSAICPTCPRLEEKGRVDARDDGPPFYEEVFTAQGTPFYVPRVHGVVAQARGVG